MSAVAGVLLESGYGVSGSDLKENSLVSRLKETGADVVIGHRASNVKGNVDLVVYTSCIQAGNPEIFKAKMLELPVAHRIDVVAALMKRKVGIAVTGAHGKGTTTALIGCILVKAGLDPTVLVGAEVADFGGNFLAGKGDFLIAEADESDGSFLRLEPHYGVITNIDKEHLEHYGSIENIVNANRIFAGNVKRNGKLFCLEEDAHISRVLENYRKPYTTFGFSRIADIYASDIHTKQFVTDFECVYKGMNLGNFRLMLPGRHNVSNALAAISVALEIGVNPVIIRDALAGYKGASRRFEIKGRCISRNIIIIEDYAHHPTEIEVTLRVCRNWNKGRIISIFQPHRFSRTKLLAPDFARAFELTDELILTDVYGAHEDPLEGVSSGLILNSLKNMGKGKACLLSKEKVAEYLRPRIKKDDVILVLGAGDIGDISSALVEMIRS